MANLKWLLWGVINWVGFSSSGSANSPCVGEFFGKQFVRPNEEAVVGLLSSPGTPNGTGRDHYIAGPSMPCRDLLFRPIH